MAFHWPEFCELFVELLDLGATGNPQIGACWSEGQVAWGLLNLRLSQVRALSLGPGFRIYEIGLILSSQHHSCFARRKLQSRHKPLLFQHCG